MEHIIMNLNKRRVIEMLNVEKLVIKNDTIIVKVKP